MIYLAADHAGFELKEEIKRYLNEQGFAFEDVGPFKLDEEDDYPDYVFPAAEKVAESEQNKGIVIGGSGQGEAMAANRVKGIRAAVYYGGALDIVKLSRQHNDSNILSLGARFIPSAQAIKAVKIWLETSFEAGKHERRVKKIDQ